MLLPDGRVGYTRSGAFSRNAEGTVVTASGYPLQPEITIPSDTLTINIASDGIVSVQLPGRLMLKKLVRSLLLIFLIGRVCLNGESMLMESLQVVPPSLQHHSLCMGRTVQGSLKAQRQCSARAC